MQLSTGVVRQDFDTALQQDIASVESFVHIHRCDTRLTIASRDCGLNRRCSSPARKKRRVQIQTGKAWNLEHITRQDLAVGNDDNYIGRKVPDLFGRLLILNARWLKNRDSGFCDLLFDWRRFNALLAPDSLIRLSDDRDDFVFGVQ